MVISPDCHLATFKTKFSPDWLVGFYVFTSRRQNIKQFHWMKPVHVMFITLDAGVNKVQSENYVVNPVMECN